MNSAVLNAWPEKSAVNDAKAATPKKDCDFPLAFCTTTSAVFNRENACDLVMGGERLGPGELYEFSSVVEISASEIIHRGIPSPG